jgi:hypothetical protein
MGIFDTSHLEARARKLLTLAREAHGKGQIGFAQQLRAQAHKYLRDCAAMGTDCNDQKQKSHARIERKEDLE